MSESRPDSPRRWYKSPAEIICVAYVVFAFVTVSYQCFSHAPTELDTLSGVLSEEKVGRNILTKITDGENVYWFTCASRLGGFSKCITTDSSPELIGKKATVSWYYQRVFPTVENRKLVVLLVDGKEIISRIDSEERLARSKKTDLWLYGFFGVVVLCVSAFLIRKARKGRSG